MEKKLPLRIFLFYKEGFRQMTLGRLLWAIILLKLFVMFFILKLFFFPDVLSERSEGQGKDVYVASELIDRCAP